MTHLDFLSPDLAAPEAVWRSPLERPLAHAPAGIEDVSRTGVLDVRGDADGLDAGGAEVVRLSDDRALVLCDWERVAEVRARLGDRATLDVSAGRRSTSRPAGRGSACPARRCCAASRTSTSTRSRRSGPSPTCRRSSFATRTARSASSSPRSTGTTWPR